LPCVSCLESGVCTPYPVLASVLTAPLGTAFREPTDCGSHKGGIRPGRRAQLSFWIWTRKLCISISSDFPVLVRGSPFALSYPCSPAPLPGPFAHCSQVPPGLWLPVARRLSPGFRDSAGSGREWWKLPALPRFCNALLFSGPISREGTTSFISSQPRPSPRDKGLQVGASPGKLLATDNGLFCGPRRRAWGGESAVNTARPDYEDASCGRA
jgi:hypothetical protein